MPLNRPLLDVGRRLAASTSHQSITAKLLLPTLVGLIGLSCSSEEGGPSDGPASGGSFTTPTGGSSQSTGGAPGSGGVAAGGKSTGGFSSGGCGGECLPLGGAPEMGGNAGAGGALNPIGPAAPRVLASDLVFPGRLCITPDGQLFFPSRIGFPGGPAEELWTTSLDSEPARVAVPGNVSGCAAVGDEIWVASSRNEAIARLKQSDLSALNPIGISGIPIQIVANSTRAFVSVVASDGRSMVISTDPQGLGQATALWEDAQGELNALWLIASEESLTFSATNSEATASLIAQVDLKTGELQELVTGLDEFGSVAAQGDYVYYAAHDRNQVRRIDVRTTSDTVFAEVPEPWALLLEGEHLYVASRPDYCAGAEGEVVRLSIAGGSAVTLASGLSCPSQLITDESGLYWVNNGTWLGPGSAGSAPADGSVFFLPR